ACRFDLARGDAFGLDRLQAILAEGKTMPSLGRAMDAAFVLFAEFRPCRLQHDPKPLLRGRLRAGWTAWAFRGLAQALILGHGVVLHDLALEHPDLHAAGAVSRFRGGYAIVDIGSERMQRHTSLA